MSQETLIKSPEKETFNRALSIEQPTRILIGGDINAGKSTLACSLYLLLGKAGINASLYELDRWSDTHEPILGEKTWDKRQKNPEVGIDEYADFAEGWKNDDSSIVIGDLEGRYDTPHQNCLKASAALGILLRRNTLPDGKNPLSEDLAWTKHFRDDLKIQETIRVRSYSDDEEQIPTLWEDVRISGLNREPSIDNPGVIELGKRIVQFAVGRNFDSRIGIA